MLLVFQSTNIFDWGILDISLPKLGNIISALKPHFILELQIFPSTDIFDYKAITTNLHEKHVLPNNLTVSISKSKLLNLGMNSVPLLLKYFSSHDAGNGTYAERINYIYLSILMWLCLSVY